MWGGKLRSGAAKGCGCMMGLCRTGYKHGQYKTLTFKSWSAAKSRCFNPRNPAWPDYGGRGITMCERWRNSFEAFLADVGPRPSRAHSIDRYPNNDGNYEPGNVRWTLSRGQNNNRRNTRYVESNGERRTIADLARQVGILTVTLHNRLVRDGWSVERALTTPVRHLSPRKIAAAAGEPPGR
jgi:hypothetical protein